MSLDVVVFKVTLVTSTLVTVTTQESVIFLPSGVISSAVTVIVAVPAFTPVTVPPATVATVSLLLLHFTFWFVALLGVNIGVRTASGSPT